LNEAVAVGKGKRYENAEKSTLIMPHKIFNPQKDEEHLFIVSAPLLDKLTRVNNSAR
jgi:hypothetical protein